MKLEVDFPTTGLPEDRELVGVEYRLPKTGDWYFTCIWTKAERGFSCTEYFIAILKPKEVWLPCTPEDAFAEMLHPGSRVIRTAAFKTPVTKVTEITETSMGFKLEGFESHETRCPFYHFEVLKTKELS